MHHCNTIYSHVSRVSNSLPGIVSALTLNFCVLGNTLVPDKPEQFVTLHVPERFSNILYIRITLDVLQMYLFWMQVGHVLIFEKHSTLRS